MLRARQHGEQRNQGGAARAQHGGSASGEILNKLRQSQKGVELQRHAHQIFGAAPVRFTTTVPTQALTLLNDPTYAGYSTGHWEGDTLVVDTVALHPNSFIDSSSPHSEEMTTKERIRFISPGILEDRITVNDPIALTKPWETVHTYKKADSPNDELREFACAEGLGHSPK